MIAIILPEGRLAKFVKPFVSLVVVLIIVSPIVNFDGINEDFIIASENSVETDADFLNYIARSKIDLYTENCIKIAKKNGISGSTAHIKYTVNENTALKIDGVTINLQNAVISSDSEHIVILQTLKKEISEYLNLRETEVEFYE